MKIKFLVYHVTLALYSMVEAFVHICYKDNEETAYNIAI